MSLFCLSIHKQIHPSDFNKREVIPGQILHAAGAPVIEDGHTTVALQTGGAIDVSSMAPNRWEMASQVHGI